MPSANYSITPGAYTLTTEAERPNSQTGDPQLEALAKRLIMQRLRGQGGGGGYSGPRNPAPQNSSSPAQHGQSPIGQADPFSSAWDPRNPAYIPMKEPVGLTAGMIPGMGENPRNIPLAMRPGSSSISDGKGGRGTGGQYSSGAGLGDSTTPDATTQQLNSINRGSGGGGIGFEEARFANALQTSDADYQRRKDEERLKQLGLLYGPPPPPAGVR